MELLTIGYEGASLDDFLETLLISGVSTVVDIREIPISRKRGFAKTRLSEALNDCGIGYVHLRALGDPKPGRDAARSGDFELFRRIFRAHLKTVDAQSALLYLKELVSNQSICLLCYERDPKHCHRSIVAERIRRRVTVTVKHLGVAKGVSDGHGKSREAA